MCLFYKMFIICKELVLDISMKKEIANSRNSQTIWLKKAEERLKHRIKIVANRLFQIK
jgi:hypothetical protein